MSVQKIYTATLVGIDAALVEVEADVSNGLPTTIMVGLPDAAIQESRERVRSAIKHSGFSYPQTRVSLNLAPGNLPKMGTHFDLPIALAILLAGGFLRVPKQKLTEQLFVGELSLDGSVKPCAGVLAMVQTARNLGIKEVFVPEANLDMARLIRGIEVFAIADLAQLVNHLSGKKIIKPAAEVNMQTNLPQQKHSELLTTDLSEIAGQTYVKRALEIAAAGGHNLLMAGPPGSGKTMLAKSLPTIMPSLADEEILELTKIYNSVGKLQSGIITQRPFRNPHHTTSAAALIGGSNIPKPGEVTLAHHGVLFLDELPEFSSFVLECLRQPLEDRKVTITRARHSYTFPASFMFVAAQNPCPCGNYNQNITNQKLQCDCHPAAIARYKKKISGPLLDRIDMHINVPRLTYDEVSMDRDKNETSAQVRARVVAAREIQTERFKKLKTNHQMNLGDLKKFCQLDPEAENTLKLAADKYQLSARTIHRIKKLARTIADLANSKEISITHVAESLQYRLRE